MIKEIFAENSIILSDEQEQAFEKYADLLLEYNAKFNLTAITNRQEIIVKHFLDCAVFEHAFPQGAKVLDVGSGAGFPGVVLSILRPDLSITLLDSVGKKISFLEMLKNQLSLRYETVNCRVEDFNDGKCFFDVVTARAVAPISTLMEYCAPFCKVGGKLLFYKGEKTEKWEKAAQILGLNRAKDCLFTLPFGGGERLFIIFDKVHDTPPNYPRRSNKPRKKPLL